MGTPRRARHSLLQILALGAGSGGHRLGLILLRRLRVSLTIAANLNSAFERGAILDADARGRNIAVHRAFRANVHAIAALDVASHFAHDHNFAGLDAGVHFAVTANGDAALGHGDFALDPPVNVKSFRAADFALDD